jgi:hypothetical protein
MYNHNYNNNNNIKKINTININEHCGRKGSDSPHSDNQKPITR